MRPRGRRLPGLDDPPTRLRGPKCSLLAVFLIGCGGPRPSPVTAPSATVPLAVHRPEGGTRVFAGEDELSSAATFPFEGARGSVRVTMEVQSAGPPSSGVPATAPTTNDILFKADGDGRISIGFRKPWPGHHRGRVTIRCSSAGEVSEAVFEPEIWLGLPSAIVTFDSSPGDPSEKVAEGREIVLARYVARNLPADIRLTLKAVFSKEPMAPRVNAGVKPPR